MDAKPEDKTVLEALLCNRAACNLELSEHFSCRSLTSLLISWRRIKVQSPTRNCVVVAVWEEEGEEPANGSAQRNIWNVNRCEDKGHGCGGGVRDPTCTCAALYSS